MDWNHISDAKTGHILWMGSISRERSHTWWLFLSSTRMINMHGLQSIKILWIHLSWIFSVKWNYILRNYFNKVKE